MRGIVVSFLIVENAECLCKCCKRHTPLLAASVLVCLNAVSKPQWL